MTDTVSPEQRSRNMAAIHSKNTKPELYFRKLLFAEGFRYGVNSKSVPGHPDLYLKKYNTAVFVHGCFWHRHEGCKYASTPKSRIEYWQKKFETNKKRDQQVTEQLLAKDIKVLVIWECTIKKMQKSSETEKQTLEAAIEFLRTDDKYKEL